MNHGNLLVQAFPVTLVLNSISFNLPVPLALDDLKFTLPDSTIHILIKRRTTTQNFGKQFIINNVLKIILICLRLQFSLYSAV